jgi:hypothetical protein
MSSALKVLLFISSVAVAFGQMGGWNGGFGGNRFGGGGFNGNGFNNGFPNGGMNGGLNNGMNDGMNGFNGMNDGQFNKNNFQASGCSWNFINNRCTDTLNLCRGGCRNFGTGIFSDCRCVPIGLGK